MRAATRDMMLFLLALSAGSADAWSYLGLGHAFVANMTGNTVLLGIAAFQRNGDWLHPLISLIAYVSGVAAASCFTRKMRSGVLWSKAICATLLFEALLLIVAEAGWVVLHGYAASSMRLNILLAVVALAVGLQSGAMLQLNVPGIVTTYITGTLTQLTSGLVRFGTDAGRRANGQREVQFEERLWMQFGVLAAYFLSAVLSGFLFRYLPQAVGAFAAAPVIVVALCSGYFAWQPQASDDTPQS